VSLRTICRAIERGEIVKYTQRARVYVDAAEVEDWAFNRAAMKPQPGRRNS
jgi:hypothetical protein